MVAFEGQWEGSPVLARRVNGMQRSEVYRLTQESITKSTLYVGKRTVSAVYKLPRSRGKAADVSLELKH